MKNLYKFICTLFFVSIGMFSMSQSSSKYGFDLIEYLKTAENNQQVPLLVEGDEFLMNEVVNRYGGNIRLQVGNLFSLEIPAQHVAQFSAEKAVKLIEFSSRPGKTLSDTMLIHTNVDSIIQQHAPLRNSYTGKGVVLGVIDSGIELDHFDFKDSLGNTRVMYVWDQGVSFNPSRQALNYNYGVEWDSASINNGISTHDDKANEFGHGSNVTGAAASNGLASGQFRGVAPETNIITVATDFQKPNWLQTVAEAVDYIYRKADEMGMPCVINASVGTYVGSHDGKDIAARIISALINQKTGRAFVCAAGNAGHIPFHVRQDISNDTGFTWFENNLAQWAGQGGYYFEVWSDTADFNAMQFSIGSDKESNGNFSFRGRTNFSSIQNRLNVLYADSIVGHSGNKIADIVTYAEESQGRYKLEVAIVNPDSANYLYRFETVGTGVVDIWANYSLFQHNNMRRTNLPSAAQFPSIINYKKPDTLQTMVSSFTCSPSVISVGNHTNRSTYTDVSGTFRSNNNTPGKIATTSSLGPNRNNYMKPEVTSAGNTMFGSGRLATLSQAINNNPAKVSSDSLHYLNGGTSMASPTVAGMVALYLQMCPKATNSQIKADLIASAKRDQFTGVTANFTYGNGKADGFNFLKKQVFTPSVSYILPNLCDGDSIQLSVASSSLSAVWNTGDSSLSTTVKVNGDYYAWVENNLGCVSPSDTVSIVFDTIPQPPVISQTGDILSLNVNGSFLWYFNNMPLNNQRNASILAQSNGNYFCIYTDGNGCSVSSDTVNVIVTGLEEYSENTLSIAPNPSNGHIQIKINNNIEQLEVFSLDGKRLFVKLIPEGSKQLDLNLSHISKGVYLLRFEVNGKPEIKKLMIE